MDFGFGGSYILLMLLIEDVEVVVFDGVWFWLSGDELYGWLLVCDGDFVSIDGCGMGLGF